MFAFVIAGVVVLIAYPGFFAQNLVAPVDRVYVATIKAGASADVAWSLAMWAIPGAIIQFLGGPRRQLGILLATGLLIPFPLAGWAVLIGIACRIALGALRQAPRAWRCSAPASSRATRCSRSSPRPGRRHSASGPTPAPDLQRGERRHRPGHQPAEALFDQALDVLRVDMRMAARHVVLLADRQDLVDRRRRRWDARTAADSRGPATGRPRRSARRRCPAPAPASSAGWRSRASPRT